MTNALSPTAANILSSLGIKGAIDSLPSGQGSAFQGCVPVLGADGKIDISFIPPAAAEMSVQHISNVLIVDPGTTCASPTGSVVAPFKTIAAAAAAFSNDPGYEFAARCAVLLMPGKYTDSTVAFSASPLQAFVICLGSCAFAASTVAFSGIDSTGTLYLQNVSASGNLTVTGCSRVACLGTTEITGTLGVSVGGEIMLSSEAHVGSASVAPTYLSSTATIANSSASISGATAKDAMDSLAARRIRVSRIVAGDPIVEQDGYEDVPAADGVYDLRSHDAPVVNALNTLADRLDNQVVDTITATSVTAGAVTAGTVDAIAMRLGRGLLRVDEFGYLVVEDEAGESSGPGDSSS